MKKNESTAPGVEAPPAENIDVQAHISSMQSFSFFFGFIVLNINAYMYLKSYLHNSLNIYVSRFLWCNKIFTLYRRFLTFLQTEQTQIRQLLADQSLRCLLMK